MTIELNRKQKFLKVLFQVMPHHAVSRVIYFVARLHGPQVKPMIRWFVNRFGVDMNDAEEPEIGYYQTFNEFFTRPLKHSIRPIVPGDNTLACPCDGTVSQAGAIRSGAIFQAKGRAYSVLELLGGDKAMAAEFGDGRFATIYLAPRDYHRVHMPLDANLVRMIHVPGRLFRKFRACSPATSALPVISKQRPDRWSWCWSARSTFPRSRPSGADSWCHRVRAV